MTTVSELVDNGDIPEERKDSVKKVLHNLGYAASRAVGKAFLKITEKQMTDAGLSIADANAILAEVESLQGDYSEQSWITVALTCGWSVCAVVWQRFYLDVFSINGL